MIGIFVILVVVVLFTIWFERRVVARMQQRIGPNRTGPFGLLQSLMDGMKLAFKEEIFPTAADKAVFILAPILLWCPRTWHGQLFRSDPRSRSLVTRHHCSSQTSRWPCSILAIASIGIYGGPGWASGSTYPLLGGLRLSAQMISTKIAMGLSFVAVFLFAGTMSTSSIVNGQTDLWFGLLVLPSFDLRHGDGRRN